MYIFKKKVSEYCTGTGARKEGGGGLRGRKERILGIGNARDQKLHTHFFFVCSVLPAGVARAQECE